MTGFCFGGGMTWNALAAGTAVKAAVPFYGPPPKNPAGLATTKAAVLVRTLGVPQRSGTS
ncbi:MAG: hypothetical protein DLM60_17890 [Pseudonocardiales bacterium]|nr:MAG: hypothetical protein DLM60_17890 [Pseudonocardiales bacterium]